MLFRSEGGIASPCIVHWPAGIDASGELRATPGHVIDLMPTFLDLAGVDAPTEIAGRPVAAIEGLSLAPAFDGGSVDREAIFWEHEGNRAIRVGKYKLVAKGANGKWELYDIDLDRSEQNDLSLKQPFQTKRMADMWQAYAERANVLPLNPKSPKKPSYNRKQKRFQLKHGKKVATEQAPFVQKKGFDVIARARVTGDGVIVAQGGVTHGWALYVQNGELRFSNINISDLIFEKPIKKKTYEDLKTKNFNIFFFEFKSKKTILNV